ncbi:hypothetical protein Baya_6017 [Bagarius yarrelli]|uniref:Uncharacterized protein n=1 Tax=Bagarius yarrelli TaxID=175774 RepID=A0A556U0U1_BAGYA|nr:hypothetical protein Baya_6017 [Bagarius yarrelli]
MVPRPAPPVAGITMAWCRHERQPPLDKWPSGPGGNVSADRRHTPRDAKNARNESRNEMNARRRVRARGRSQRVASSPRAQRGGRGYVHKDDFTGQRRCDGPMGAD